MPLHRFLSTTSTGSPRAWNLEYAYYDPPQSLRWDLTTAVYADAFSVAGQETAPTNVFFKPDGTKMYVIGITGDDVNEYDLSQAWDISSASYVQNFSVAAQDTNPYGLFFREDGLKMYTVGTSGAAVYEYDLGTAWDISSAVFLQNYPTSAQETSPRDVFFKPDGLKMYVVGATGDNVNEYDLSTAWDISTASYLQSIAVGDTTPSGLGFSPNGDKMYVTGDGTDDITEFTLSTPWNVTTATITDTYVVSGIDTSPRGMYLRPDGAVLYFVGSLNDNVYKVSMGGYSVSSQETSPHGISFKPDGTKMYITGFTGDDINEYDLSTPWDTSTATYLQNFSLAAQDTAIYGHYFKPDGTRFFVAGSTNDSVYEYNLSTPWDVSTASFDQSFSVAVQETAPYGVHFSTDGTKMYVIGISGDDVNEYTLTTAWEMSTASFTQSFSVSAQESAPYSVFFRPDGSRMFVSGTSSDAVHQYDLSTPWSVSTAVFSKSFKVSEDSSPTGLFFREDGLKMFTVGTGGNNVYTYSFGQQP